MFFRKKSDNSDKTVPKRQIDMSRLPKHIGIIMDGNGRWAKRRGLPRSAGHRQGAKTLEKIMDYCISLGIEALTAYAFSTENWNRPEEEVSALMDLLYSYLISAEKRFAEKDARFMVSGDISRFDDRLQRAIKHAEDVTKDGKAIIVNLALNYGGRDEIVRAARKVSEDVKKGKIDAEELNEQIFASYLDTASLPEVDLIIRPSGEQRLSNFLLWQAAYSEFWFSDICWPDFKEENMKSAIIAYQNRDRRFGAV